MTKLKKLFKNLLLFIILFVTIGSSLALIANAITLAIIDAEHDKLTNSIHQKYTYVEEYQYYIDENIRVEESNTAFKIVYDQLPDHLEKIIKEEWTIVVSDEPILTYENVYTAAGCTYNKEHLIWLMNGFSEDTLCHEIGHALDSYFGCVSDSEDFYYFYETYWNSYHEFDRVSIDKHSTSVSNEFFAALFTDYIIHRGHIEEYCPDVITYFEDIFQEDWSLTGFGKYFHFNQGLKNKLFAMLGDFKFHKKLYFVSNTVSNNVKDNPLINTNDYTYQVDYAWVSHYPKEMLNIMFDMIENPDKYETKEHFSSTGYIIEYDFAWDRSYYDEILSFVTMYFGDETLDPIDVNVSNGVKTTVVIKKDLLLEAERKRQESLKNIDATLATMHTGTETEMLIQISEFITNKISYSIIKNASSEKFWDGQNGDCVTYAMMFKQFANRLGIHCDVIYVRNSEDIGHVYNRIQLEDGLYRYYDLSNNIVDEKEPLRKSGYHINCWYCS